MAAELTDAARRLLRSPGFAITAVASLALAVGANTAIFSVVNALWLRPLAVRDAQQLVVAYYPAVHSRDGELLEQVRLPLARELAALDVFQGVTYELTAATRLGDWRPVLRAGPGAEPFRTSAVASNFFQVLGVEVAGRAFTPDEESRGADPVAIVSAGLWRNLTGRDAFTSGASIPTTRGAIPIVGVAPAGFRGARLGDRIDVWIPMGSLDRLSEFAAEAGMERLTPVTVFARLGPDVSRETAEAAARSVLNPRTSLRTLREYAFPLRSEGGLLRQRSLIQTLWVAAALVLLLGSANLAALFSARSFAQRRDRAVRRALGASGAALVRLVLAEGVWVAAAGLAAGLVFRRLLLSGIGALETSSGVPIGGLDVAVDWRVLVFGAVTTTLALGLATAAGLRHAARTDLAPLIAQSAGGGTRKHRRLRQLLLASHASLTVALLVVASALASAVARAFSTESPYAREELIVASVRPRFIQHVDDTHRRMTDYERAIEHLDSLPFVEHVSNGDPPLRPWLRPEPTPLVVDGRTIPVALLRLEGGPGYLTSLRASMLEGRDLTRADIEESVGPQEMMRFIALRRLPNFRERPPKGGRARAVIDQTLARILWPHGSAVGRAFTWKPFEITYVVVGVTEAIGGHPREPAKIPTLVAPQPLLPGPIEPLRLVMRVTGSGEQRLAAVAAVLRQSFPDAPILEVNTAAGLLRAEMAQERMGARIFSYYAAAAILLALTGVYGLMLFYAASSRHEFAVRYALGATRIQLSRMALIHVLTPVAAGTAAGVLLSHAVGTTVASRVVGLGDIPWPLSFMAAAAFCALCLLLAVLADRRASTERLSDALKTA